MKVRHVVAPGGMPRRVELDGGETVAEYLRRWIRGRRALRESTVLSYEATIDNYLVPHLGDIELRFLLAPDIDAMYTRILERGSVSVATVMRIHATLMSALNAAVRAGVLDDNPAELVELPRVVRTRRPTWEVAQLSTFLRAVEGDELFALYAVLALRGLRRGEAIGLQVGDVDLVRGQVHIERQIAQVGARAVVGDPKSRSGIRTVAIDAGLVNVLDVHLVRRAAQVGRELRSSDWMFGDSAGGPLKPLDVTRRFRRTIEDLGLPLIRLHDLRHTSATLGLASGETLLEVSRRLGHSSVAITGDIYSEVPAERAREAAERMASVIWRS